MRKAFPCHDVVMLAEYRSHLVAYYRSQQKIIKEQNVCTSKRAIYVASIIQQSIANLPVQRTYLYDVALPDPTNNHPLFVKWPRGVLMSHMTSNLIWLCWLAGVWTGLCDAYYLFNEPVLQVPNLIVAKLQDNIIIGYVFRQLIVDARMINTHNSTIGSLSNNSCTQHLPSVISWDMPIINQSSITP